MGYYKEMMIDAADANEVPADEDHEPGPSDEFERAEEPIDELDLDALLREIPVVEFTEADALGLQLLAIKRQLEALVNYMELRERVTEVDAHVLNTIKSVIRNYC